MEIDLESIAAIVREQSRIALINYDAAMKNQANLCKLTELIEEQSRQTTDLIHTAKDLLRALEIASSSRS